MSDNKTFRVNVQTSTSKKINVTSNVSENYITASPDTGLYYSRLSEKWATGEGLVENKDYSSKTYATQAKEYAEESKMYSESASLDLGNLENKFTEYNTQLDETVAEGLVSLQTSVAGLDSQVQVGKTEINNVKEQAITTITTKTDDSLDTLETKTQESIERIENTSGGGSANAVTTDTEQTITGKKTFTQEVKYSPVNSYKDIWLGQSGQGYYGLVFQSNNGAYDFAIRNQGYTGSSLKVSGFGGGINYSDTVNFNSSIYDKEGKEIKGGGSDYVAKSGDTMTGSLNFQISDTFDYTDTNHTTTAETSGNISFKDKNNMTCGSVSNYFNQYNNLVTKLTASREIGGIVKSADLSVYVDKDGNPIVTAPSSVVTDSVVTTKSCLRASSGYYELGNGLIIQWGGATVPAGATSITVTLPITFRYGYKVVANHAGSGATPDDSNIMCVVNSNSQFTLNQKGTISSKTLTRYWIAIGT